MTFTEPDKRISSLAEVLKSNVDDPAQHPAVIRIREVGRKLLSSEPWVAGTPAWVPRWKQDPPPELGHLGLLELWSLIVAQDCATKALEICAETIGDWAKSPFRQLVDAAMLDLPGTRVSEASERYNRSAAAFKNFPVMPVNRSLGVVAARTRLEDLSAIVDRRAAGTLSKNGRLVFVITMGVENYNSPLIARLPGVFDDLNTYIEAFKARLQSETTDVSLVEIKRTENEDEVLKQLREIRQQLSGRPGDLAIFIFSGRGIELNGRRYLATASAELAPSNRAESPNSILLSSWRADALIDLWQIAEIMSGSRFIGIYDTQFSPPLHESGRYDQLLDKHVDSVRPQDVPGNLAGGGQQVRSPLQDSR